MYKTKKQKWSMRIAILIMVIVILAFFGFMYLAITDTIDTYNEIQDWHPDYSVEDVSQLPEYVPDWEAIIEDILVNSKTVNMTPYAVGGGTISTIVIGLASWNLKETYRVAKMQAAQEVRITRNEEDIKEV